jgi:energy-coupling factor transporter ATP-binding protein EcfA2
MRIDYLKIPKNRNLRDFEIDFDQNAPMTVLLGRNGSGKSNLIENLVEIFMALEKAQAPRFAYEMKYYCYGQQIEVTADPHAARDRLRVQVNGKAVSGKAFERDVNQYLPANVFAYYSGWNARLENLFAESTKRYYRANLNETTGRRGNDPSGVRRFFFCRKDYAQFALLSLFFETHELARYIREEILGITEFDSVLFVLKTPWWARRENRSEFFWGAKGSFTAFMDRLRAASLAPIKNEEALEWDVRGRTQSVEKLYLYIRDQAHLDQIRAPYESPKLLFNHLESMFLSDLIEEVRVIGRHKSGQTVTFKQLSEGEQQLVTVFGLLLFTKDDETLYLLDEPDSHLNPRWAYDYLDLLRRAFLDGTTPPPMPQVHEGTPPPTSQVNPVVTSSEPGIPGASQVILATHNPLVIGPLRSNQVRIMQQEPERTTALPPTYDPVGVGVEGLLKSEFGLRSTLAPEVLGKLDRHYQLLGKKDKTDVDTLEVMRLANELNDMAVSHTHPNPYFEQFATAMAQHVPGTQNTLTIQEIEEQAKFAQDILNEIIAEEAAALETTASLVPQSEFEAGA